MRTEIVDRFVAEVTSGTVRSPQDVAAIRALVSRALLLAESDTDVGDLRCAVTALEELFDGSRLFQPFHDIPKATVFGSARTAPDSELYHLASELSAKLAAQGWWTVTGAGPGIMEASSKGAGRQHTIGVNIELPFEHGTNGFVDVDHRHIATSYFFTRKVIMTRSSQAFVAFPGGVGTMDELFEILTLLHTGKTTPVPVVLVDRPGGTFWTSWHEFMLQQMLADGYVSDGDDVTYFLCDNVDAAIGEITGFYRNYVSCVTGDDKGRIVVRHAPTEAQLLQLRHTFLHLQFDVGPDPHGTGVGFNFNGRSHATLRRIINEVNQWG